MSSLLDLRRLRYFVAVAEELHFGRAAKRLQISQPPLSLQIQVLERELDAALFERTRQRVHLTAAGRVLLQRAVAILAAVDAARAAVMSASNGQGGELRVGFTASSGLMPFLHRSLHRFRQLRPAVRLVLSEMPSLMQLDAVEARSLDVAIIRQSPVKLRTGLDFRHLFDDVLVVAVHESNPLAGRSRLTAKSLRHQPFIAYPRQGGIGIAQQVDQLTASAGFQPKIVQEARDSSTIVGLVAAGLGIGIVPSALSCIAMDGVRYIPLRDRVAQSAVHVVVRQGSQADAAAELRDILVSEAVVNDQTGYPLIPIGAHLAFASVP